MEKSVLYVPSLTPSQKQYSAIHKEARAKIANQAALHQEQKAALQQEAELASASTLLPIVKVRDNSLDIFGPRIPWELLMVRSIPLAAIWSEGAEVFGPLVAKAKVTIERIQCVVCRQYNISCADMISSRQTLDIVWPRQIAMYLAKTLTRRSLPEIGRYFGGRDHTTVLHAVNKVSWRIGDRERGIPFQLQRLKSPICFDIDEALVLEIETLKHQLQE